MLNTHFSMRMLKDKTCNKSTTKLTAIHYSNCNCWYPHIHLYLLISIINNPFFILNYLKFSRYTMKYICTLIWKVASCAYNQQNLIFSLLIVLNSIAYKTCRGWLTADVLSYISIRNLDQIFFCSTRKKIWRKIIYKQAFKKVVRDCRNNIVGFLGSLTWILIFIINRETHFHRSANLNHLDKLE